VQITAGTNANEFDPAAAPTAAQIAANQAAADGIVAPAPVATVEEQVALEPVFSFTENAGNRGRLKVEVDAPAGCTVVADTAGVSCRGRDGRPTKCRGRNLTPNQPVTFTCE